jgi:copper homeostasis protein
VDGIVLGALTEKSDIDIKAIKQWVDSVDKMGITFHRAFDLVEDPFSSLETLIDLGCQRVLTSGQSANVGKKPQPSQSLMKLSKHMVSMGSHSVYDNYIDVTDPQIIRDIIVNLRPA